MWRIKKLQLKNTDELLSAFSKIIEKSILNSTIRSKIHRKIEIKICLMDENIEPIQDILLSNSI